MSFSRFDHWDLEPRRSNPEITQNGTLVNHTLAQMKYKFAPLLFPNSLEKTLGYNDKRPKQSPSSSKEKKHSYSGRYPFLVYNQNAARRQ